MNQFTNSSPPAISSRCYIISNYQRFINAVPMRSPLLSSRATYKTYHVLYRETIFLERVFRACNPIWRHFSILRIAVVTVMRKMACRNECTVMLNGLSVFLPVAMWMNCRKILLAIIYFTFLCKYNFINTLHLRFYTCIRIFLSLINKYNFINIFKKNFHQSKFLSILTYNIYLT